MHKIKPLVMPIIVIVSIVFFFNNAKATSNNTMRPVGMSCVKAIEVTYSDEESSQHSTLKKSFNSVSGNSIHLMSEPDQSLEEYVVSQCLSRAEAIDISKYNVPVTDLINVYSDIKIKNAEMLVDRDFKYSRNPADNTKVGYIIPTYLNESAEEDAAQLEIIRRGIADYISRAAGCKNTLEKIFVIHDEIIKDCRYDVDLSDESYYAYGLFANRKVTCQGYAQAFYVICRDLGIEAEICASDEKKHMWNYVKVDGKWYHIDLTWDDPILTDEKTEEIIDLPVAFHDNFLISDETATIEHGEKSTWLNYANSLPDCDYSDYENDYLFNIPDYITMEYDSGAFKVPYIANDGKEIILTTEDLHTGPVIAAESTSNQDIVEQYFYCLRDTGNALKVITAVKNQNGRLTDVKISEKGFLTAGNTDKEIYKVTGNINTGFGITFFFWQSGNMIPFTYKSKIEL